MLQASPDASAPKPQVPRAPIAHTISYPSSSRWLPMLGSGQSWRNEQPRFSKPSGAPPRKRSFTNLFRQSRKDKDEKLAISPSLESSRASRRHSMPVQRLGALAEEPAATSLSVAQRLRRATSFNNLSGDGATRSNITASISAAPQYQTSSAPLSVNTGTLPQLRNSSTLDSPSIVITVPEDDSPISEIPSPLDSPSLPQYLSDFAHSLKDKDGKEELPKYATSVHLQGFMSRKMEMSEPGVRAKDRSWKTEYIVVQETTFKVWKHSFRTHRHPDDIHVPTPADKLSKPLPKNTLIRSYTLQFAEAGLATDYFHRSNVVRVRAEGEQFLVAVRDAGSVVDFFEALQASINVAVALDERPVPKFHTLPRRRLLPTSGWPADVINEEDQTTDALV